MQPRDVLQASYAKDMSPCSSPTYIYIYISIDWTNTWYPYWWLVFSTSARHLWEKIWINKIWVVNKPKNCQLKKFFGSNCTFILFSWVFLTFLASQLPAGPVAKWIALNPWGPSLPHDWPEWFSVGETRNWRDSKFQGKKVEENFEETVESLYFSEVIFPRGNFGKLSATFQDELVARSQKKH